MSISDALAVTFGMIILTVFGMVIGYDFALSLASEVGLRAACESSYFTIIDCAQLPEK